MVRNLTVGGLVALALGFSPFTAAASADDWLAEQSAKLRTGVTKIRNSNPDYYDKWLAGQEKLRDYYFDYDKQGGYVPRVVYPSFNSYGPAYYPRYAPVPAGSYGSGGSLSTQPPVVVPPVVPAPVVEFPVGWRIFGPFRFR